MNTYTYQECSHDLGTVLRVMFKDRTTHTQETMVASAQGDTLDGMTVKQLRELAERAENAAKAQEAAQKKGKKRDRFTVSAAVEVDSVGALVCMAKDGTRWFTIKDGHWIVVDEGFYDDVFNALAANDVFPYTYADHTTFKEAHRPTYSGVRV